MATLFRTPQVTRIWQRDPAGAAVRATVPPNIVIRMLGTDQFFYGAGRGPNYDFPNPIPKRRSNDLLSWVVPTPVNLPLPTSGITILVRAPYLTSDTVGTKTFTVYEIDAGVLTAVTVSASKFTAIPNITNGWWLVFQVAANGAFGDFAGIVVFDNINGAGKAAVEVYSPPTSIPSNIILDKVAPYLASDTIATPGYQLYTVSGLDVVASGSHVTTGIVSITGITNGNAARLVLTPGANNGAQMTILWDGG